ncbi:MAG: sugar phosphate isomerase/epimerase family protein [Fimbriimonadaceae bacterium]|nr:sugar phosphate isomerase/epimerase family protein [Fimbriimonadaceae bacterium]
MKLGFVSAILPDLSLADVLATAAEIGYDAVELMAWPPGKAERRYAGVTHVNVAEDSPADVRAMADDAGITLSGIGYYPNMLSADAEEARVAQEHFRRVLDFCAAAGVPVANTFVGRDPATDLETNYAAFRAVWPSIVAHAESVGVNIGIENCPMYFSRDEWPGGKNLATTPAIWRRMFSDLPSARFGLNYDPSHLVWQMMDYVAPLAEFAGRLHHLHLKDAKVDRAKLNAVGIMATPLEYHAPVLPGRGDIDWPRFFDAVRAAGYDGPAVVEVEDREYEGCLDDRKRALRVAHDTLRPLLS